MVIERARQCIIIGTTNHMQSERPYRQSALLARQN
jgi:hypothetical protein